ncbi:hypothetical protein [Bradyrhizobium liaoningense]|uniref:hypothetical protein n=1 Tax=Bradyrhizobium liaoningense TaxID=43992 RepID=UPI001BA80811|nr:hypothetical protein [Bradyrhizobium liaoningense]MBR1070971.1 hypothetical protein [Bradyrhizobium liaoningense]
MDVILPFVSAGAFEPNDIEAMSLACEEVCHYLHINGDARARESIAARVIELESWPRLFGQRPAGFKWIPAGLC